MSPLPRRPTSEQLPLASRLMALEGFRREPDAKSGGQAAADTPLARATVVFTTGAAVRRYDWLRSRYYEEVLEVSDQAINLDRLERGAPVLDSHSSWSLDSQFGRTENPRIKNGRGTVDIVFSRRPDAAGKVQDVQDGITRNVSVGYTRDKVEMIPPLDGSDSSAPWEYRVKRWTPHEVSFVSINADMDAQLRSDSTARQYDIRLFPVEIETTFSNRSHIMDPTTQPQGDTANELLARGAQIERQRQADIRTRCKLAKLSDTFAARLIEDGVSGDAIASRIFEQLQADDAAISQRGAHDAGLVNVDVPHITGGERRGMSDLVQAATDALLIRAQLPVANPHPAAVDLRRSRISDIARYCLTARGHTVNVGRMGFGGDSPIEVLRRAMSTSDLPLILEGSIGKALRNGYMNEPASHKAWTRPTTVPDFKAQSRVALSNLPDLEKVNEGGEYKHGSLSDDKATIQVYKYGKITGVTWEMLVNDDLDAILQQVAKWGQKALQLEADLVYNLIKANAGAGQTMQDSVTLFHANHGNLEATAAADFTADRMALGRVKLRKQTALGGGLLNLTPVYLIVPPEYETTAEQIIAERLLLSSNVNLPGTTGGSAAPWYSTLRLVVEPRLSTGAIYLAADWNQVDTCEVATLEDQNGGPVLERKDGFQVDETMFKIRHVVGANFIDWRGIVKVPVT